MVSGVHYQRKGTRGVVKRYQLFMMNLRLSTASPIDPMHASGFNIGAFSSACGCGVLTDRQGDVLEVNVVARMHIRATDAGCRSLVVQISREVDKGDILDVH